MHPLALRNLTGIYGLYVYDSNITVIEPDHLNGISRLQILKVLSHSEFIKHSKASWDNNDLHELDLSYNHIREIKPHAFLVLTALERLDLSYNEQLSALEITSFSGLKNLRHLDLTHTFIEKNFIDIPPLQFFSLADSRLGSIFVLDKEAFKHTMSLQEI